MRAAGIVLAVASLAAVVVVVAIVAHFRYRTRDLGRRVRACDCERRLDCEIEQLLDDALGEELR
jgi:hypothetical protein